MAEALKEAWPAYDECVTAIEQARGGGFRLGHLIDEGPADVLSRTEQAQPALLLVSFGWDRVLRAYGVEPVVVAGHSLGEYTALLAAGALDLETALGLVLERAHLMGDVAMGADGGMSAVLGMDADAVSAALASMEGSRAYIANLNCPGQVVISGERPALAAAQKILLEAGARKVVPLAVSGAFHSPMMAVASEAFADRLAVAEILRAEVPVIQNSTAEPATEPADLVAALEMQMTGPVRWEESLHRVAAEGIDGIVEVGPGTVLKGLVRRTLPHMPVWAMDDERDRVEVFGRAGVLAG
jgi:[acyl-carrier-protein] S-malonyltransferase